MALFDPAPNCRALLRLHLEEQAEAAQLHLEAVKAMTLEGYKALHRQDQETIRSLRVELFEARAAHIHQDHFGLVPKNEK